MGRFQSRNALFIVIGGALAAATLFFILLPRPRPVLPLEQPNDVADVPGKALPTVPAQVPEVTPLTTPVPLNSQEVETQVEPVPELDDPLLHCDYLYDGVNGDVEGNKYALPVWVSAGTDGYGAGVPSSDYTAEANEWTKYQLANKIFENYTKARILSDTTSYSSVVKVEIDGAPYYIWRGALIQKGRFHTTAERLDFEKAQAEELKRLNEM